MAQPPGVQCCSCTPPSGAISARSAPWCAVIPRSAGAMPAQRSVRTRCVPALCSTAAGSRALTSCAACSRKLPWCGSSITATGSMFSGWLAAHATRPAHPSSSSGPVKSRAVRTRAAAVRCAAAARCALACHTSMARPASDARSGAAPGAGHTTRAASDPMRKSSPAVWTSGATPRSASHAASVPITRRSLPAAARSHAWPRRGGTITRSAPKARTTSGMAEQCSRLSQLSTTASRWRTPSAANAGTMRREPALSSLEVPASNTTQVRPARTSTQEPLPTSSISARSVPGAGAPAWGRAGPSHSSAARSTSTPHAPRRTVVLGAIQATGTAITAATTHHAAGRPVHHADAGRSQATCAVQSRNPAQPHATAPGTAATAAGSTAPRAMAATPAMVTSAAAGMVSTLMGAA